MDTAGHRVSRVVVPAAAGSSPVAHPSLSQTRLQSATFRWRSETSAAARHERIIGTPELSVKGSGRQALAGSAGAAMWRIAQSSASSATPSQPGAPAVKCGRLLGGRVRARLERRIVAEDRRAPGDERPSHVSSRDDDLVGNAERERYEDWEVDDPAEADLEGVRRIRDDIDARVQRLLAQVAPSSAASS
jgi:hypothetical protein